MCRQNKSRINLFMSMQNSIKPPTSKINIVIGSFIDEAWAGAEVPQQRRSARVLPVTAPPWSRTRSVGADVRSRR